MITDAKGSLGWVTAFVERSGERLGLLRVRQCIVRAGHLVEVRFAEGGGGDVAHAVIRGFVDEAVHLGVGPGAFQLEVELDIVRLSVGPL